MKAKDRSQSAYCDWMTLILCILTLAAYIVPAPFADPARALAGVIAAFILIPMMIEKICKRRFLKLSVSFKGP
jgi:hypothetical protein